MHWAWKWASICYVWLRLLRNILGISKLFYRHLLYILELCGKEGTTVFEIPNVPFPCTKLSFFSYAEIMSDIHSMVPLRPHKGVFISQGQLWFSGCFAGVLTTLCYLFIYLLYGGIQAWSHCPTDILDQTSQGFHFTLMAVQPPVPNRTPRLESSGISKACLKADKTLTKPVPTHNNSPHLSSLYQRAILAFQHPVNAASKSLT